MTTNQHAFDHYPDESQLHDAFDRDLHPAQYEGQKDNSGNLPLPTLYDQKAATRELPGLTDDELRRIPVLREGTRLDQGSTYLDLADPNARPFTAQGGMVAGPDSLIIPKDEVDYLLWNRLTGVSNPERLDESPGQG
jgi:hypothetical protein